MAPKKKAAPVPTGPSSQEVEETYKGMDKVLEAELQLLRDTLASLQSETLHNNGLVERYGSEADQHQSEIERLDKSSSAELLRLAKLYSQAESQLKYHTSAVAEADRKVEEIYDDMDRMRKEDQEAVSLQQNDLIVAVTTQVLADGSKAAPEFPPPIGTSYVDTNKVPGGGEQVAMAQSVTESVTRIPATTHRREEQSMSQEELAALFYARTRQLQVMKEKVSAARNEEAAVMAGQQRLSQCNDSSRLTSSTLLAPSSTVTSASNTVSHKSHLFLPRPDRKQTAESRLTGENESTESDSDWTFDAKQDSIYRGEERPELSRYQSNKHEGSPTIEGSRQAIHMRTALKRQSRRQLQYSKFQGPSTNAATFPVVLMGAASVPPFATIGASQEGCQGQSRRSLDFSFHRLGEVLVGYYGATVHQAAVVPQSLYTDLTSEDRGFDQRTIIPETYDGISEHNEAFRIVSKCNKFTDGSLLATSLPSNGTQILSELSALREHMEEYLLGNEQQQQQQYVSEDQACPPSAIVLLKGRVVPHDGNDDDLFISFTDIDDGPTATPSGLSDELSEGNQGSQFRPTTISVKALIKSLAHDIANLMDSSPGRSQPQVLVLLEISGCTGGSAASKDSSSSSVASDNNGFLLAVGPTSSTRFMYQRAESSNIGASTSLLAIALTELLTSPSSTASGPMRYSADSFASALFSKISDCEQYRTFIHPPAQTGDIPQWAQFKLSQAKVTMSSSLMFSEPCPPLPCDPIDGNGIVTRDGTVLLSYLMPDLPASASISPDTMKAQDRERQLSDAVKAHIAANFGDGAAVLQAGDLAAMFRAFQHEEHLAEAVAIMGNEVASHLQLGSYDSVAVGGRSMAAVTASSPMNQVGAGADATDFSINDISVVYNPSSPLSPFYANASAAESVGAARFASAVRGKVLQNQSLIGEGPNGEHFAGPNASVISKELFSTSRLRYTTLPSATSYAPLRQPIYLLLNQKVPLDAQLSSSSSLSYGPVLRELQQELTYRRLETRSIPIDACYKVEVWGATRRQVAGSGANGAASPNPAAAPLVEIQVTVVLWPVDADPLEKWYLKVRHEAKREEDRRRLLLIGGKSNTIGSGGASYLTIRNTAVSVSDTATATLTQPMVSTQPTAQGQPDSLSATESVKQLCIDYFSKAIAIKAADGEGAMAVEGGPNTSTNTKEDTTLPIVNSTSQLWQMVPMCAVGAFVHVKDLGTKSFLDFRLGAKASFGCYNLTVSTLFATSTSRYQPRPGAAPIPISIQSLSLATVQRRYGPTDIRCPSLQLYNPLRARGALIALFLLNYKVAIGSSLPQQLALRQAIELLSSTPSYPRCLLGRDIIILGVNCSELLNEDGKRGGALQALAAIAPKSVLDFMSSQSRPGAEGPFPCLILFQSVNRSVSASSTDTPSASPSWVIPARHRVGTCQDDSQVIVPGIDIANGVADYLARTVLSMDNTASGQETKSRAGFPI